MGSSDRTARVTSVTVTIVLHQSAGDIGPCLAAVRAQTRPPDAVVVFDNASTDDGLDEARLAFPDVLAVRSDANLGFAAGHNRAIDLAPADVHVVLNPDCQLAPQFIERTVAALAEDRRIGAVTGRLLRFRTDRGVADQPPHELPDDILDSTGMVGLRNRRVLDRGTEESSRGAYTRPEYVFGASGAAAVYRREMLEDVAVDGEIFDEAFFAYREDVDLAWRAQMLGWRCLYVPAAVARHRRRVAPGRRRLLPSAINRRSIANRWRMIAKNETAHGMRRDWAAIAWRDVLTLGYCVVREPGSLGAVADVVASGRRLRRWRRALMARRRAPDAQVAGWFGGRAAEPVSPPLEARASPADE